MTVGQPRIDETATQPLQSMPVNSRVKIAAMWTSMLFVFAYVDIFSFYRADFRAEIEAGEIAGFTIGEAFLLGTTVYVLIPSLMVLATLVMRPQLTRIANISLAALYAATIIAGAIGEWSYYMLGSVVEVALLAAIAVTAWRWPRREADAS